MSANADAKAALEKELAKRESREELERRNILPAQDVAPALQEAKKQLQKAQLSDKLDNFLEHRPTPEAVANIVEKQE